MSAQSETVKVLLVEDNPDHALLLRKILAEVNSTQFELTHVGMLREALERLGQESFDVILLDLSLPDSSGLDSFLRMYEQVPTVPIIVLTGIDDKALAVKAVRAGAQDYLVKGQVDGKLLERSICYAIERYRLLAELRALSLIDELTGLYNRRGFLALAQQQLRTADRRKVGMLLLFADLDGMKHINDNLGHYEGDLALIETAEILKMTFRLSDIVARIGGDEFVVLAMEASADDADTLVARLQEHLKAHNAIRHRPYKLSLSIGVARYDPERPCSIEELLVRADAMMYEQKRNPK